MVTGTRTGLFLKECVVGRAHRTKGKKKKEKEKSRSRSPSPAVEDITGIKTISGSSINRYLSALCRLHKAQQAACNGQVPSPRVHPTVIAITRTEKLRNATQTKSHLNDRTESEL
jgi:hypothetical protein